MGVADNKSYKDQYHFKKNHFSTIDVKKSKTSSLNVSNKVTSTIKDNPFAANVEIEKNEMVIQPELQGLHKAIGKTHAQGGIKTYLEPGSFIISDDPSLSFTEADHDLFEFKKGGNFNPKNNTPAKVLNRVVDVKHYNTLIENITDPKLSHLTKSSSILMLEKYIKDLGKVAYLQEFKKGMPDGLPPFSQGAAPVYEPHLREELKEIGQYFKRGGPVKNEYQLGGEIYAWEGDKTYKGNKSKYDNATWRKFATEEGFKYSNKGDVNKEFQSYLYNKYKDVIDGLHTEYGMPKNSPDTVLDGKLGRRWDYIKDAITNSRNPNIKTVPAPTGVNFPRAKDQLEVKSKVLAIDNKPRVNEVEGEAQNGVRIPWGFNKWQRLHQSGNLYNLASLKKYSPYREQVDPNYIDPRLANPEQAIADAKSTSATALQGTTSLSPILRMAQSLGLQGTLLDTLPGIRASYDNQNMGTLNQTASNKAQIFNNANMYNSRANGQYYKEAVTSEVNLDNAKTYARNKYLTDLFGDVTTNQKLAYNLATLGPKPAFGYDFDNGDFYRNDKNLKDVYAKPNEDQISNMLKGINPDDMTIEQKIKLLGVLGGKRPNMFDNNPFLSSIIPTATTTEGKYGGLVKKKYINK